MAHQEWTVSAEAQGRRLDHWLGERLRQFSRNQIKRLLDDGRLLINGRRVVIAGWELNEGDTIELRVPAGFSERGETESAPRDAGRREQKSESRGRGVAGAPSVRDSIERHLSRRTQARPQPAEGRRGGRGGEQKEKEAPQRGNRRLHIYHEDRDLIVVEKPAGILSVPGQRREEETMLGAVRAYMKRRHPGSRGSFVSPMHRLDAETSGIMVFALSKEGERLSHQFRDHSIRREYTAICRGAFDKSDGIIDLPLEKGEFGEGKKVRIASSGEGRRAVTEFRVKERYAHATLVELRVRTGRTHQIRVHLAHKGYPLVGDKLYSEGADPEAPTLPRHALHAHVLGFKHPQSGKKLTFHSPIPSDIAGLIDLLRGN